MAATTSVPRQRSPAVSADVILTPESASTSPETSLASARLLRRNRCPLWANLQSTMPKPIAPIAATAATRRLATMRNDGQCSLRGTIQQWRTRRSHVFRSHTSRKPKIGREVSSEPGCTTGSERGVKSEGGNAQRCRGNDARDLCKPEPQKSANAVKVTDQPATTRPTTRPGERLFCQGTRQRASSPRGAPHRMS